MSKTIGTLFTGFGGVDVGAKAAGLTPLWGVELRADVAEVANLNLGNHVRVANILDCDPHDFAYVDVLHASPPCPNFSIGNANRGETEADIALAMKVAEFIKVLQPDIFTLENVMKYRESKSWQIIEDALIENCYWHTVDIVNAADMGVPQSRRRMIVRARRNQLLPFLPSPVKWVGWYAAIEDIIHTLPDSQFAPWQMARLPDELKETLLVPQGGYDGKIGVLGGNEPSQTITANTNQIGMKAFLNSFAICGIPGSNQTTMQVMDATKPISTVTSSDGRHPTRAFLVNETSSMEVRRDFETCVAQVSSGRNGNQKAFIVNTRELHGNEADSKYTAIDEANPVYTLPSTSGATRHRAFLGTGRVVAMTPRALARFQSYPDWYVLPAKKTLSAYGIGNSVPPLMYQRIIEGLLNE